MSDLAKRTWPEAEELFGADTVVILPVGSTEPHGPHLPLDTDVTIAVAQARRAAERMEARGVRCVVLPALPYGLTNFTDGFAGTVGIRPGTLWGLIEDVIISLSEGGVQRVVLSNGHLEPAHVKILRDVILDFAQRRPGRAQVIFPDNTRRRWAETLNAEFRSGDCHAGRYEGSIVLAADEPSVRREKMAALPAVRIDLIEKMKAGSSTFKECGADEAYCGDPAAATAVEGTEMIERLAEMIETSVEEAWPDLFA